MTDKDKARTHEAIAKLLDQDAKKQPTWQANLTRAEAEAHRTQVRKPKGK